MGKINKIMLSPTLDSMMSAIKEVDRTSWHIATEYWQDAVRDALSANKHNDHDDN